MNRTERRRAERQLAASMRRATVETAGITATCAWPSCRAVITVAAPSMQVASDRVRRHYEDKHGGREPQPIEGNCLRCKQPTSITPDEPLMLCEACREPAG